MMYLIYPQAIINNNIISINQKKIISIHTASNSKPSRPPLDFSERESMRDVSPNPTETQQSNGSQDHNDQRGCSPADLMSSKKC